MSDFLRKGFSANSARTAFSRKFRSGCGASQREKGDVVLLLPAFPHVGVEPLHNGLPERPLILGMPGDERPNPDYSRR